jgi:hypothetical protein
VSWPGARSQSGSISYSCAIRGSENLDQDVLTQQIDEALGASTEGVQCTFQYGRVYRCDAPTGTDKGATYKVVVTPGGKCWSGTTNTEGNFAAALYVPPDSKLPTTIHGRC